MKIKVISSTMPFKGQLKSNLCEDETFIFLNSKFKNTFNELYLNKNISLLRFDNNNKIIQKLVKKSDHIICFNL